MPQTSNNIGIAHGFARGFAQKTDETFFGLTAGSLPVPLQSIAVDARLTGRLLALEFEQTFKNEGSEPIEAVYRFPLPEKAALTGFTVVIGKKTIVGQIEARDKAFERYDDALSAGHGAFLLDQERPNVFTVAVGNILPGEKVTIHLNSSELLEPAAGELELRLPTTIGPRYTPPGDTTEGVPLAEQVAVPYAGSVPYTLAMKLTVDGVNDIISLSSPSHDVKPVRKNDSWQVELAGGQTQMDRDLVVLVKRKEEVSQAWCQSAGKESFYAVEIFGPKAESEAPLDMTFLVDISGSMGGSSLVGAKRAMEVALRAMPTGARFNICFYDTSHELVFGEPRQYGIESLNEALAAVRAVQARGGTELLPALRSVLAQKRTAGRRHAVLLLTDGDVGNEAQICSLAKSHRADTRIFVIGIGHGPNGYLIGQLARSGGGASLIIGPTEAVEEKTLRIFGKMLAEPLEGCIIKTGRKTVELPRPVTVFCGESLSVVGRAAGAAAETVTLEFNGCRASLPATTTSSPLAQLWARERISELEACPKPDRAAIEKISLAYGVMSSAASFVAVEKRAGKRLVKAEAIKVRVPLLVTAGHGVMPCLYLAQAGGALGGAMTTNCFSSSRSLDGLVGQTVYSGLNSLLVADQASSWCDASVGSSLRSTGNHGQLLRSFSAPAAGGYMAGSLASLPPQLDPLMALLLFQGVAGGFNESPELLQLIGADAAAVAAARKTHGDLAITWLVLQWLNRTEKGRESLWRPLLAKSLALFPG